MHLRHAEAMATSAFARLAATVGGDTNEMLAPEQESALQDNAARIAESLALGIGSSVATFLAQASGR